jgi:hypothetical protein
MKALLISLAVLTGQMISMQDKPVVHLKPHSDHIDVAFRGSLLELQNAPQIIHLPEFPPKPESQNDLWSVDVRNFGPRPIVIVDKEHFSARVGVSQTIHIYSNGTTYFLKR